MAISVGEYLRRMREERGLTLDQIGQTTRISQVYLQALENDEIFLLPSKVQGKGFLRLYADVLQIDAQPLLNAWPDQTLEFPTTEKKVKPGRKKKHEVKPVEIEPEQPEESISEPEAIEEQPDEEIAHPVHIEQPLPETDSQSIFEQIGAELHQQRETLNLSVGDVERFTRLRPHYITALEKGQLEDLPSLVQARGMLSNYSEFLDMDSEAMLMQFAEALQSRRIERASESTPNGKPAHTKSKKQTSRQASLRRLLTPDLLIGGSIFILLVAFIVWGAARIVDMQRLETDPTALSISEILMSTETEMPLNESLTETAEGITTNNNGSSDNGAEVFQTLIPDNGDSEDLEQVTIQPEVSNTDPIQVYVIASQRAWLQVVVDTRVAFEGRVVPGNAYPFSGFEQIELATGNGAAIQVIFNQNNLGALGVMGEVVRLIFTEEGTLVPTPQFTITPTPTLSPTPTLTPTPIQATPTITPLIP